MEKKKGSTTHVDILREVKQLLNEGADPNVRSKENYTMLQLAVRNGHNECLEALINDGKARLDKRGPYDLDHRVWNRFFLNIFFRL